MPKFNIECTVVAECNKHSYEYKEMLTRRMECDDIEVMLSSFWLNWNSDDYGFFKHLEFCPECESISGTSCEIHSIEILDVKNQGVVGNGEARLVSSLHSNTQNRELYAALSIEYHEVYSAYAVYCAIREKVAGDPCRFRKEHVDNYIDAVVQLFDNDKHGAKSSVEHFSKEAKDKIQFTSCADHVSSKSVPTYVKNIQNKSLCDALRVAYHKIHAAKAVVMILKEHGIEPRTFRADNKLDFAGAVLALFNGDAVMAKKSLEKNIKMARSM